MKKRVEKSPLEKQKDLVDSFYKANKRMPSYSECCALFGVASKDTAYRIIQKLVSFNFLEKDPVGKIVPILITEKKNSTATKKASMVINPGIKMLGLVEAGFPSPAEEDLNAEEISLDDWIIRRREASFMLRVKGDSMYDAGIRDGDMVVVERGITAKPGDIVIARIDEGWTMKYLRKKGSSFYLQAANADYPDMEPAEVLEIAAVVRGVIRKY